MSDSVPVLAPVELHEMDKRMRFGMENLVRRIIVASVIRHRGRDPCLDIYMAGFSHGTWAADELRQRRSTQYVTECDP